MPQANSTHTSPALGFPVYRHAIDITFEEFPLVTREFQGQHFFAARIDGVATIEFADIANWQITDISLSGDNQKIGAAGRMKNILLNHDKDEPLIWLIMDALTAHYTAHIEEKIDQAIEEDRDWSPRTYRAA